MAKFGDTDTNVTPFAGSSTKFGDMLTTDDMPSGASDLYAVVYELDTVPANGALFSWGNTRYSTVGKPTIGITDIPLPTVGMWSIIFGSRLSGSAGAGVYAIEHYSSSALYRSQTVSAQLMTTGTGFAWKVGSIFVKSVLSTDYIRVRNIAGLAFNGAELQVRLVS